MTERAMLADKVAVVTGGRGGIGQAICARFAREGARVIAADLAEGAGALAEGVSFARLDVTREPEVQALMAELGERHGRLDVLVNAAAIEIEFTIEETSLEDWNRIFAVNVTGTFLVSKHALPLMRAAARPGATGGAIGSIRRRGRRRSGLWPGRWRARVFDRRQRGRRGPLQLAARG